MDKNPFLGYYCPSLYLEKLYASFTHNNEGYKNRCAVKNLSVITVGLCLSLMRSFYIIRIHCKCTYSTFLSYIILVNQDLYYLGLTEKVLL